MTDFENLKARLESRPEDHTEKLDLILDVMVAILTIVEMIQEKIGPLVDTVSKSPIFRMMGGK